jgi:hypothetical protein
MSSRVDRPGGQCYLRDMENNENQPVSANQKRIAQMSARSIMDFRFKLLRNEFHNFEINPTEKTFNATHDAMVQFLDARNVQRSVAEWEVL